jgi:exodeoxyribonuclease VII small subunit
MSEPAEPAFEAIVTRLAEVVGELERGDVPLESSLALFEEGVRLARLGGQRLDDAEARVEELLSPAARSLEPRSPADAAPASRSPQQREPR